eukprot:TRINITY_DN316_c0_g1_i1.p1 TRINITY_DN316_c0_g1~~TRINITY_DN316_c0_g1_i1.p1  ORF type:complete len:135 (+),score=30.83 TRINITY_DN316_c0_g1_i1:69-473(+)
MKGYIVCLLALFVALAIAGWSSCGTGTFHVSNVVISPNPPRPGQNLNVQITGTASAVLTGGTVSISVAWDGITVKQINQPVCTIVSCPVRAGPQTINHSVAFPSAAPSGSYVVTIKITNQNGGLVSCVNVTFNI